MTTTQIDIRTIRSQYGNHTYNTRNKHNLRLKQSNRVYMYKNISFVRVHIWNDV